MEASSADTPFPGELRLPSMEELRERQARIKAWEQTDAGKEFQRIRHIAIRIEGFVVRLDNFDELDKDWFWGHPETGCVERPSLEYRVHTANRNIWEFFREIHDITGQLQRPFDGSQEIVICLNALNADLLDSHEYVFQKDDEEWCNRSGYREGIGLAKQIFQRAQQTFRGPLLLLAQRAFQAAYKARGVGPVLGDGPPLEEECDRHVIRAMQEIEKLYATDPAARRWTLDTLQRKLHIRKQVISLALRRLRSDKTRFPVPGTAEP